MTRKTAASTEVIINPEVVTPRGRHTVAPAEISTKEFVSQTPAHIAEQELLQNTVAAAYGDDRDLMNQLLGQAQALNATAGLLRTFGVSKLAYVKENKLYRALAGRKNPNGSEFSGTWEEFCNLLGVSSDKVNEDIANHRAFGEAALEQMSRMGIGYRELRQYRRLPEDEKVALIEVAKSGDKEGFVDLAEEIFAKHAKEKEALTAKVADLEADAEALSRINVEKTAKADALDKELKKRSMRLSPWPDEVATVKDELHGMGLLADEVLGKHLTLIDMAEVLVQKLDPSQPEDKAALEGHLTSIHRIGEQVERICILAAGLRNEYELRLSGYVAEARSHILPAD